MILTHTNKHCSRHCLVMGQDIVQAIKKEKEFHHEDVIEKNLTGKLQNFLWHMLKPQLPAMIVVNLGKNLYSLYSKVLKELTPPSLGHYNYFKIAFETVIQMLRINPVMCEYFKMDK